MNDLMLWVALAGGEVLLVVFVLLLVYWIRQSGAARRDRKAVAKLIARARKGKATREGEIRKFLSEHMGLSDNALEQAKTAILREEFRLLQGFADTYRRRDSSAAARFQMSVEAAVAPYFELRANGKQDVIGDGQVDESELEALRNENARLSEELSVTMDTMSRMLSEYSSMFAQHSEESPPVVDEAAVEAEGLDTSDEAQALGVEQAAAGEPASTGHNDLPKSTHAIEGAKDDGSETGSELQVDDDSEVTAPDAMAEIVDPDSIIDQAIEKDPLEEGLGGLFDGDDTDSLDGDVDGKDSTYSEKDSAIAI